MADRWAPLQKLLEAGVSQGVFIAAVALAGLKGELRWEGAAGALSRDPGAAAVTLDTVFDLASLTKPLATALALMVLMDRWQLDPAAPLGDLLQVPWLPPDKRPLTLTSLLTHRAGLPAWRPFYREGLAAPARRTLLARLAAAKLGRDLLRQFGTLFSPETLLKWNRTLVARKYDGSDRRGKRGPKPTKANMIRKLVIQMAQENGTWGYGRIYGELKKLGYDVHWQTVRRVMLDHGLLDDPDKPYKSTWKDVSVRRSTPVLDERVGMGIAGVTRGRFAKRIRRGVRPGASSGRAAVRPRARDLQPWRDQASSAHPVGQGAGGRSI